MPKLPLPSRAVLTKAFLQDLPSAWNFARQKHPKHTPYAFVLYGVGGGLGFIPLVLTEESLTQAAQRHFRDGYFDTLEESRQNLRYSPADAPDFADLRGHLPSVEILLQPHKNTLDETTGFKLLAEAAIAALGTLDKQKLFGKGPARNRLTLCVITQDTETEWLLPSAKRLNPGPIYKRLEKQSRIEGLFASSDLLALSPDGRTLFFAGNRNLDEDDDIGVNEIVACTLQGRRLRRQWTFPFPIMGESCRALACSPDGRSLYAVRSVVDDDQTSALVMQFPSQQKKPAATAKILKRPAAFVLARDGSRAVLATKDKSLVYLDTHLKTLATRQLSIAPIDLLLLRSGNLLIATKSALYLLAPKADTPRLVMKTRIHCMTMDSEESLLAISQWVYRDNESRHPKPTGVQLVRLKSFKPLRTILIPNHECVAIALSPNGRLLACGAHEFNSERKSLVVFETATGRELARRKSDFIRDIVFLPDNQTLAITKSGFTTGEPIDLWRIPT